MTRQEGQRLERGMRGTTRTRAGSRGAIEAIASDSDRARAFRRARRHTFLVRFLRLVLPAIGIASLGLYSAALVVSSRLKSRDISVGQISVDPTNLRMADPRYNGFAKDGAEYKVHAKSAVSDLKMAAPVRLDMIDGEIKQPTGVVTRLNAAWGTYDQKQEVLELFERIDIVSTNGMKAWLTRATLLAKENRIISPEPVRAETATGNIRANSMTLDTKTRKAAFRDAVEVTLRPAAKPPTLPQPQQGQLVRDARIFGLDASSGEPIVVTSRRLDVDDLAKTALFREAVVARQGTAEMHAPELDVAYAGDASVGQLASPRPPEDAAAARLRSIKARGGVTMINKESRAESQTLDYDAASGQIVLAGSVTMSQEPDRRVTGETATLDQRADSAVITGDVVATQARNVLRGGRLAVDRVAGTARLTRPADNGVPAGRISTVLYQNNAAKAGSRAQKDDAASGTEQGLGIFGESFKSDPNAPIEVEAVSLDVNDRKHTAVYTGAVVAKQGDFIVRTEEMTAHYSGEMGLATGSAPTPREKSGAPGGAELRRIEARRNVVVTGRDGQQATGEWANFDVKSNNITMGGNVTVTQGKQLVRAPAGMRLVIDLSTGVARFEAEPGSAHAKSGPQVSGAFATSVAPQQSQSGAPLPGGCPPGAICKSGRLEAIFYPNQIKDKAKQRLDAAGDNGAAAAAAAKKAAQSVIKRLPAASSWSTTNQRPATP